MRLLHWMGWFCFWSTLFMAGFYKGQADLSLSLATRAVHAGQHCAEVLKAITK